MEALGFRIAPNEIPKSGIATADDLARIIWVLLKSATTFRTKDSQTVQKHTAASIEVVAAHLMRLAATLDVKHRLKSLEEVDFVAAPNHFGDVGCTVTIPAEQVPEDKIRTGLGLANVLWIAISDRSVWDHPPQEHIDPNEVVALIVAQTGKEKVLACFGEIETREKESNENASDWQTQ